MTAPFDPRALSEISQTLETTCVVTATTPDGVPIETLDVLSLVLTMDEAWSPMVQAEMTATLTDPTAVDPRTGVRLAIDLGYSYPGGTLDQHTVANLAVTDWTHPAPDAAVNFNAHGDELALQQWVPLGGPTTYPVGTSIVSVIVDQLWRTIGRTPHVTAPSAALLTEPLTVGPGSRVWSVLAALADQAGIWVHADPLGTWQITTRPAALGEPVVQVATGPTGIVTGIESGLSRIEWGNAVEVEYDGGRYAYAAQTDGPMGTDAVGVCAVAVRHAAPWPGTPAAEAAARSVLLRTLTRGSAEALTALAAWWVRPGDTITRPDGSRAIVARVRFTYPDSLMTITTREAN